MRVLVVDDSVIARRVVSSALGDEPGISIIGSAPNGKIALRRIQKEHPDLVILDLEMPEMDGIETLHALRDTSPETSVIVFSSHTVRGALKTLDALQAGARDYVTKPSQMRSVAEASRYVRDQLVSRVRALFPRLPVASVLSATAPARRAEPAPPTLQRPVELVVVASSTGGPSAVTTLLSALPAGFPAPILIVQHMPALFTRIFAQRLSSLCQVRVSQACGGEQPSAGEVWLAPGDQHLAVERGEDRVRLVLRDDPPENGCRPAADVLFRTAARAARGAVLGVVLTGMGVDGTAGARAIVECGGAILAEDASTSVARSMPESIRRAGLALESVPLPRLADRLQGLVQHHMSGGAKR